MKKKINNFFTLKRSANGGFTLVELVVVIAILAILAGAAVPAYSGYINKANEAADQQLLAAMNTAYASACAAEGKTHIGRGDVPVTFKLDEVAGGYKVPAELIGDPAINENFNLFFPDGQFKRFTELGFNATMGVFVSDASEAVKGWFKEVWNQMKHSFTGEGDIDMLLGVFDKASIMFSGFDFDVEEFLFNFSDDLMAATGLGDIFGGIQESMQLSQEEIASYEKKLGRPLTDEEKEVIMGNKAVLQMAQAAAGADADATKRDVDNFINIVKNANDLEWLEANVPDGDYNKYLESYFLENADPAAVAEYKTTGNVAILNEFLDSKNHVNISGRDAAFLSLAAEKAGTTNTTGVNTLGSLYALAAGYFNQEGSEPLPGNVSLGSFDAFVYAVSSDPEGFYAYYESQGSADMDAYLAFMGALSDGNVDLTDPNAFSGMSDYISDLLK